MGIDIFHGYGFETAKPSGFVPVAISTPCAEPRGSESECETPDPVRPRTKNPNLTAMAASRSEERDQNQPVVLVTGCSEGGIGHAMARAFAAAGCAVVATARSRGSMRGLDGDPRFLLLELDVRSDESARAAVADALREHGRIDVLVNNAGVHLVAPLAEVPMESFHQVFDTNVYGRI
jgi:hypothetical protein